MRNYWQQHWFLTTLAALIVAGMTLGFLGYDQKLQPLVQQLNPRWITAGVLFLMAFSLASEHLWAAFRSPRPVLLGCLMNYGVVPLLAWGLMGVQQSDDFRFGLMIASSVPCTVAAASVMTRKARGNDAVSLLTTLATNLGCFVLTPLWLQGTTGTQVELPIGRLMLDLLEAVLAPTIAGQLLRQPARLHDFAVKHKAAIGVAAQVLIEVLVLTAALRAGVALRQMKTAVPLPVESAEIAAALPREYRNATPAQEAPTPPITVRGVFVVWSCCVGIHSLALGGGWWIARRTGSSPAEAAAVAFAGSQKTLPIGLLISTDPALFGSDYPFAMFPMLLYHTSQLFLDTWVASRLARRKELAPSDS
ncbi:MAG: bile acid:sodium symporter family protein [Planctomycetales bacterium]